MLLLAATLKTYTIFLSISGCYSPNKDDDWKWWILQIGTIVIATIGIVGNCLSFLAMKSKRLRTKSYSHYLCALAVFDSLTLLGKCLKRVDSWMVVGTGTGIFDKFSDATCKFHNFATHVCYLMSTWLVLCITMERFIAVFFPFKRLTLCKPRKAMTVILAVFAVMSYTQIFRLIVIDNLGHPYFCGAPSKYLDLYIGMHVYFYQVVMVFSLPALIIIICNMMILHKIRHLKAEIIKEGSRQTVRIYAKKHKTTVMLLLVSFTFVIALLPSTLISMLLQISLNMHNKALAQALFCKLYNISPIAELLSEINYGVNFFIYVLSAGSFRYELKRMCRCRRYHVVRRDLD